MRLPAKALELSVIAALLRASSDTTSLIADAPIISAKDILRLRSDQQKLATRVQGARISTLGPMLLALDLRIVVEEERILASVYKDRFFKLIDPQADWNSVSSRMTIPVPASLQRRGQEQKLRLEPAGGHSDRDPKLVALVIRAHAAREQLVAMDMTARRDLRRELARVARIAYLAPDIVAAIIEGRHPSSLRSRKLERGEIPLCWKAQREMLGFS